VKTFENCHSSNWNACNSTGKKHDGVTPPYNVKTFKNCHSSNWNACNSTGKNTMVLHHHTM